MSESNQRSKSLIRELYVLSESGAFDNVESSVVEEACEFLRGFTNPIVSYKDASVITGKSISSLYTKICRNNIMVETKKGFRWKAFRKLIAKDK